MGHKSLEDFENDGFTIYEPGQKKQSSSPAHVESKIVVIDNKELVAAVERTNAVFQQSIATSNATMQASIESLAATMANKPDSFTLDIERDQRGFMTSVTVKINK